MFGERTVVLVNELLLVDGLRGDAPLVQDLVRVYVCVCARARGYVVPWRQFRALSCLLERLHAVAASSVRLCVRLCVCVLSTGWSFLAP